MATAHVCTREGFRRGEKDRARRKVDFYEGNFLSKNISKRNSRLPGRIRPRSFFTRRASSRSFLKKKKKTAFLTLRSMLIMEIVKQLGM